MAGLAELCGVALEKGHAVMVTFGDFDLQGWKTAAQMSRQQGAYWVFRIEMPGIDEGKAQSLRVPEVIVFDVRCNQRVASGVHRKPHFVGAGTSAHGNLTHRLAAADISQPRAAQSLFDMG